MKKKLESKKVQKIGSWAFIIGIILAIVMGAWDLGSIAVSVLVILGIIVGFLNVTGGETNNFLFATLVLVVTSSMGGQLLGNISYVGALFQSIFAAMMLFIIPAAIVVALKAIYALAED